MGEANNLKTAAEAEVKAVETSLLTKVYAALQANPIKVLLFSGGAGSVLGFIAKSLI